MLFPTALLCCLGIAAPAHAGGPIYRAAQAATDPGVAQAWQLDGDGPMGIESAWDQTTGGDVTVAIVDTGVDMTHPELSGNLWTNPGEIPGNGIDDDHDGFVDDVHGADFVNHDGDPTDDNGHGTHVAGIIGARGDNGIGAAGVAWNVHLMPVKVLDAGATGDAGTVADGVRYAVAHGAKIINLSLSGPGRSDALEKAIADAGDAGALVVVAAGNDGHDLGSAPAYPASYPEPNIVAVAATAQGGRLSSVSNYGAGVDIAAPGESIFSTARGGGYELRTGTSMASPEVAGTAALISSVVPGADWHVMEDAILGGARRGQGLPVATGALDVAGALHQVIPDSLWRTAPAATPVRTTPSNVGKARKTVKKPKAKAARKTAKKKSVKHRKAAKKHRRRASAAKRKAHSAAVRVDGTRVARVPARR